MTTTDSFGRDARSIMNTLNNIKDPGSVERHLEENWGKATYIGFNSIDFDELIQLSKEYFISTTLEYPYLTKH